MNNNLKIGLAEDHDILRQTMSKLLIDEDFIHKVYQSSNGKELLKSITKNKLDLIILDLNMPVMDGRETIIEILKLEEQLQPKIIILSMHYSPEHIRKYIGMGANAFLSKGCEYTQLISAVHDVMERGFHFNKIVTPKLVDSVLRESSKGGTYSIDNPLSDREIQILQLICKQKRSVDISEHLGISLRTVENHRMHIMKKIGAKNSVGLLVYAMKNGILDIEQL